MSEKKIKVTDTVTTNGNSPQKLLIDRLIPEIIPVVIPPINQTTVNGVVARGDILHVVRMIISKEIVTEAVRSAARYFKDPPVVNWKDTNRTITQYGNTV